MALYDKADLLAKVKVLAKQPAVSQDMTDVGWYSFLTEGQIGIAIMMAAHVPEVNYGAPVKMVTADNGETYTLPTATDEFIGMAEVRASRNGYLLTIGAEFDPGVDFTAEGSILRTPDGKTRTFPDGPYIRFVPTPGTIDASTEPTLKPTIARVLIMYRALQLWASRGGLRDPKPYLFLEQKAAFGDPNNPGEVGIIGALKQQYYGAGAVPPVQGAWWQSGDLG